MITGKRNKLGILSLASIVLYLLMVFQYPLTPSLDEPRASWVSLVDVTWVNFIYHLSIYIGLFLVYILVLRILTPGNNENGEINGSQTLLIILTWLVCSFVLLFAAPAGESHDIFDYLFRGRMMVEYDANPLIDVPADFDFSTPFFHYLAWKKNVDTYGPVWEIISAAIAKGVHFLTARMSWWNENYPVCPKSPESCQLLIVYVTGYRLLAIALTGMSGWLIYRIVENNWSRNSSLALAAWLLNPMTLITTAVGGHNDALMLVLVILSWWLLQREQPIIALVVLVLGAHVKLTALIWLPTIVLWIIWRWGWRHALKVCLVSFLIGLVISWFLYRPFAGWQTLPQMLTERSKFFANSIWRILNHQLIYRWGWSKESAHQITTLGPNILFAVGALIFSLWMFNFSPKRWRRQINIHVDVEANLWHALAVVSILYLLVGSFWFQHWYVLWALAPAVLIPDSHLTRSVILWLTFGALSSNLVMSYLLATLLTTSPRILNYISEVLLIWGPVFIAESLYLLSRWRRKRKSKLQLYPSIK